VHAGAQLPVWRSGTLATRSEPRASASAVAKPPTMAATSPLQAQRLQGLVDRPPVAPRRDTTMCRPRRSARA
jgi:hypothetical protein